MALSSQRLLERGNFEIHIFVYRADENTLDKAGKTRKIENGSKRFQHSKCKNSKEKKNTFFGEKIVAENFFSWGSHEQRGAISELIIHFLSLLLVCVSWLVVVFSSKACQFGSEKINEKLLLQSTRTPYTLNTHDAVETRTHLCSSATHKKLDILRKNSLVKKICWSL